MASRGRLLSNNPPSLLSLSLSLSVCVCVWGGGEDYYRITINLVAALTVAWIVINWLWLKPKKLERLLRLQGLNGTPYRILHGDTKKIYEMAKDARSKPINLTDNILPRILPFYHQSMNKYGKNYFVWIGTSPRLCIMDPKMINEILTKNNIFKKLPPNQIGKLLVTGLSSYEDEKWAKHRKIVTPAFHLIKLKNMLPTMILSCNEMMREWESVVSSESSYEMDVWPYLQNLTSDVISRTAFGSSYKEGRQIFELQRKQALLAHHIMPYTFIPGWRFIPTKSMKKMREIFHEVQGRVQGIISKKQKEMNAGGEGDGDLLGMMLRYNEEEIRRHGNRKDAGMSIDDIIEECKLFYFAGHESTANLLAWTMVLLGSHPNWQEQAREEVFHVLEKNLPDYNDLTQLKILTMILQEALRLYPPGPIITRTAHQEVKLGNLTLPAGVQLLLPKVQVHRDREIWGEDAEQFKPERFSEGVAKATKNQQVSYFPFSWGPRTCIGNNFAMMEAKIVLSMILQRFSFELPSSYVHAPFYIATLKPQHGVQIILRRI